METENLSYHIKDEIYENNINKDIFNITSKSTTYDNTYQQLIQELEAMDVIRDEMLYDDYMALELEYNTNYTLNALKKIAGYYKLNKNQKKNDVVRDIVIFEKNPDNIEIVTRRKKLWIYMKEIQEDPYLCNYCNFD